VTAVTDSEETWPAGAALRHGVNDRWSKPEQLTRRFAVAVAAAGSLPRPVRGYRHGRKRPGPSPAAEAGGDTVTAAAARASGTGS
jgi:hypothetical protein